MNDGLVGLGYLCPPPPLVSSALEAIMLHNMAICSSHWFKSPIMPLTVLTASGHLSRRTFDGCPLIDEVQECTFIVVYVIFSVSHDTCFHVGECAVRFWCDGLHVWACCMLLLRHIPAVRGGGVPPLPQCNSLQRVTSVCVHMAFVLSVTAHLEWAGRRDKQGHTRKRSWIRSDI